MSLAVIHSRALDGLSAAPVTVEVHLANGLPCFTLVGLADTEVREARERVRSALHHSGLEFPLNRRITVSLAPADLPKESGRFDLPIALGILAASGQVDGRRLDGFEFAGELSLAGVLRPVRGALAMAFALRQSAGTPPSGPDAEGPWPASPLVATPGTTPRRGLVLPTSSAHEAALVADVAVFAADDLRQVVAGFAPATEPGGSPGAPAGDTSRRGSRTTEPAGAALRQVPTRRPHRDPERAGSGAGTPVLDLADVRGHAGAKRALEIAAAGAHSLLLVGPPGTGKSMLAQRLPGLLPPMTDDEAMEAAAVASLERDFHAGAWGRRAFRAPHHSASAVALVGGGNPPRPGEISLAHEGVLFLDELPEFSRSALESLREPLETGRITIARAARRAEFPARFQLVAALNPCPCGHRGNPLQACRCSPEAMARYEARLSGPLLERLDLLVEVPVQPPSRFARTTPAESEGDDTATVARRVAAARRLALVSQGVPNARLTPAATLAAADPTATAQALLTTAAERLGWSARTLHRLWRIARTVADLAAVADPGTEPGTAPIRRGPVDAAHVAEAIQYRRALAPA